MNSKWIKIKSNVFSKVVRNITDLNGPSFYNALRKSCSFSMPLLTSFTTVLLDENFAGNFAKLYSVARFSAEQVVLKIRQRNQLSLEDQQGGKLSLLNRYKIVFFYCHFFQGLAIMKLTRTHVTLTNLFF